MATTITRGFHPGELAMQERAGVSQDAARLAGMLGTPRLEGGVARFLTVIRFAAITGRDDTGRLWTSLLTGEPGFIRVDGGSLVVAANPDPAGPLARLHPGSEVALIAIEFGIRRRARINGTLTAVGRDGFTIEVDQAFGNCPAYIQQRALDVDDVRPETAPTTETTTLDTELTSRQIEMVRAADTFFLGTAHPTRGMDTSHKGGRPGFVRVEPDGSVWWPDYAGNNMFNSLGNIAENPEASLLFVDFERGSALALSGRAEVAWVPAGTPGDDGGTGRRVVVRPERVTESALPLRGTAPQPSPDNPELR
jgi:hypothetical protein